MTMGKRQSKEFLNWLFGKTPATTPAGVIYVSLHTGDPGDDGQTANESSGGSYARKVTAATDWDAATDADPAVTDNANVVTFVTATADWSSGSNMTYFGLWKSLSGTAEADFIGRGALTTAKAVKNGDTPNFPAGDLNASLT